MFKLSKRCQVSKNQTPRLWRRFTKKLNSHNEVHRYWCQFWCHIWWSLKTLKMSIESIFDQFWWPSYLTSKLTSISVILMSIYIFFWTSSIVQMFDYLTFDIFLTNWHLLTFDTYKLNHLSPHSAIFFYHGQGAIHDKHGHRSIQIIELLDGVGSWTFYWG